MKKARLSDLLFVPEASESEKIISIRPFVVAGKIRMLMALAHAEINTFFQIYSLDCCAEKWKSVTTEYYQRSFLSMNNLANGNAVVALVSIFGVFFAAAKKHIFVATARAHRKAHHMNSLDLKVLAILNFIRNTLRIGGCVYFRPSAKTTD